MKIEIKELEKIRLEPGDVLVVKVDNKSPDYIETIKSIRDIFPKLFPKNSVITAPMNSKFEVIKQKALK